MPGIDSPKAVEPGTSKMNRLKMTCVTARPYSYRYVRVTVTKLPELPCALYILPPNIPAICVSFHLCLLSGLQDQLHGDTSCVVWRLHITNLAYSRQVENGCHVGRDLSGAHCDQGCFTSFRTESTQKLRSWRGFGAGPRKPTSSLV